MATGGSDSSTQVSAHVEPVFMLNKTLPALAEKEYTTAEICEAAEVTSGYKTIMGAQKIRGVWRLYPNTTEARQTLLIKGLVLRHVSVTVRARNPAIVSWSSAGGSGGEIEIPTTKLIIGGDIPISFSDDEIVRGISALNCDIRSKLILERDRDKKGKLTRWVTGRRFLYISVPDTPLPKKLSYDNFTASLYHREQKLADRSKDAECRRCLQKGHAAANCPNDIKCRQCFKDGHRAGDGVCQMAPDMHGLPPPPDSLMPPPLPPPPPSLTPQNQRPAGSPTPRGRSRSVRALPLEPGQQTLDGGFNRRERSASASKRQRSPQSSEQAEQVDKHAKLADDTDTTHNTGQDTTEVTTRTHTQVSDDSSSSDLHPT